MTLEQAKALRAGQWVHQVGTANARDKSGGKNADGTPRRWKVTSVKTWKRSPERVEVRLKHGLRFYDSVTESNLHLLELGEGR